MIEFFSFWILILLYLSGIAVLFKVVNWTKRILNPEDEELRLRLERAGQEQKKNVLQRGYAGELLWPDVRRLALERDENCCNKCGSTEGLHVHHVKPVGQGGTNQLDNLITLCSSCHGQLHGHDLARHPEPFRVGDYRCYGSSGQQTTASDMPEHSRSVSSTTAEIIRRAIQESRVLRFGYRKPDSKSREIRTISPTEIFFKNGRRYVRGHCHLRRAERVFRVSRMSNVEVQYSDES